MSAGTLIDALIQLPPFFANQTPDQVNGGQNSGGSNLNLRGAGLNRTLVLLDGRRVVPDQPVRRRRRRHVPRRAAAQRRDGDRRRVGELRHGRGRRRRQLPPRHQFRGRQRPRANGRRRTTATARRTKPASRSARRPARTATSSRSIETYNVDAISDVRFAARSGFLQAMGPSQRTRRSAASRPTGAGSSTPPAARAKLVRPYVSPTNWNQTGIINEAGGGTTGGRARRSTSSCSTRTARLRRSPFSGVGELNGGCNCQATSTTRPIGGDIDDEVAAGNKRTRRVSCTTENAFSDNLTFFAQGLAGKNDVTDRRESISFVLHVGAAHLRRQRVSAAEHSRRDAAPGNADPGQRDTNFAVRRLRGCSASTDRHSTLGDARQITKNELFSGTVGFKARPRTATASSTAGTTTPTTNTARTNNRSTPTTASALTGSLSRSTPS